MAAQSNYKPTYSIYDKVKYYQNLIDINEWVVFGFVLITRVTENILNDKISMCGFQDKTKTIKAWRI